MSALRAAARHAYGVIGRSDAALVPVRGLLRLAAEARLRRPGPHPPILVYQMSKVGSQSVVASLRGLAPGGPVFHVHFMEPGHLDDIRREFRRNAPGFPLPIDHVRGRALGRAIRRLGPDRPYLVVTLVRDPVARAVSSLFQAPQMSRTPVLDAAGSIVLDRCVAAIEAEAASDDAFAYPERWFRRELLGFFGFDVFAHAFDREAGHALYEHGKLRVLVVRMEGMSHYLGEALARALRRDRPVPVTSANVRGDTAAAQAYRALKRRVRLPADRLRAIYDRPYTRHFYPEEMIERFIETWSADRPAARA